ncbi:MAG: hypothetical protein ACKO2L_03945 [Planctomycetaceae bacterium]
MPSPFQAGDIRLLLELIPDKVEGALLGLERSVKAIQADPAVQRIQKLQAQQLSVLDTALRSCFSISIALVVRLCTGSPETPSRFLHGSLTQTTLPSPLS